METTKPKSKINLNLESLRGFAALFVVVAHIINHDHSFNKSYSAHFLIFFFRTIDVSHLGVLIFFVLSGYVIGISNKNRLTKGTILDYLKKRFVRLYPIYIICVLVTLFVAQSVSAQLILSTFTFTQGLFTGIITENGPLWSLNYEVLYYLLFIPISLFNFKPALVLVSSILIAATSHFVLPDYSLISSYFYGFAFWSTGLCIARYLNSENKVKVNSTFLTGCLFYIISITALTKYGAIYNVVASLDKYFSYPVGAEWYAAMVPASDLVLLPYCLSFVVIFAGINFRFRNTLFLILQIFPIVGIFHILTAERDHKSLLVLVGYYFISIGLFIFSSKINDKIFSPVIKFGTWVGSISYAIYVIHFPVLFLFGRTDTPSLAIFGIKVVVFLFVIFGLSYFLEKVYQPWARGLLLAPKAEKVLVA
jgi:peptidoglycan/LPS O-acetylase OafA/YrhL